MSALWFDVLRHMPRRKLEIARISGADAKKTVDLSLLMVGERWTFQAERSAMGARRDASPATQAVTSSALLWECKLHTLSPIHNIQKFAGSKI